MNKLIFLFLFAFFSLPALADDSFSFKDDRLGMKLSDFQFQHKEPTHKEQQNFCSAKNKCGMKTVQIPDLECKALDNRHVACYLSNTIVGVSANETAYFADEHLFAIAISFPSRSQEIKDVADGFTGKFGVPTSINYITQEPGLIWENEFSMAILQPHYCAKMMNPAGGILALSSRLDDLLNRRYCGRGAALISYTSSVLIADKKTAAAEIISANEEFEKQKAAKKSDF